VEVMARRNKKREPCIEGWRNYDNVIIAKHVNNIGCRTPYHTSLSKEFPTCNIGEKMKKAGFSLSEGYIDKYPSPCRSLEKIMFSYEEFNDVSNGSVLVSSVNLALSYKEVLMTQV
jgi:hypothetical protein